MAEHPPRRDHETTDADDREVDLDEPDQPDPPVDDDAAPVPGPSEETER